MIEIAKECRTRYNCIFFGYADTFSHLIVQEGFEFRRMEPWLSERDIARLWKIDRMERLGNPFSVKQLRERVSGELLLYKELNPVAVVMGFTLSATISCRAAGIPLVCVMPFSYTAPFFKARLAVFPESFDLPLLRRIPDRIQRRLMSYWGLHTRLWAGPFRRVAREYGILGLDRTMDLFQGDHNLVATVPELTGVRELPPGWRYVGPIYARLPGEPPEEIKSLPGDLPLIYFAMGSSARQDLLVKILNCFEGMPYRIVSPMKFHLDKLRLKLPENVQLYDWLPAHKVNPLADLAIIHGGEGTVQTACLSGKPFIGIGLQPEQEANLEYCVGFGNGIRLRRREVSAQVLRDAIERVLSDAGMQEKAAEIKILLEQSDGPKNVAAYLAQVFGSSH